MTIIKLALFIIGIIISLILLIIIFLGINYFLIKKPQENKRGWRTKLYGRDPILYEEKINGEWKSIIISAEMLVGKVNKVIYFKNEKEWNEYPKWAQNRNEIIKRVKLEYPPKNTEYEND